MGDSSVQTDPSQNTQPRLNKKEQQEVENRSAPGAQVVYGAVQREGEQELKRSSSALAWSGLAAGLSMGFSFVAEALLEAGLPDTPWRPLISKLGYSVGFLIVVLGRQQLFTENTLTPVLPLLSNRTRPAFMNVLRLWGIVLATNLVGALLFALIVGHADIFQPDVRKAFAMIGSQALQADALATLIKAVFAGWLIALMLWLLPAAETGRIWIIIIITYIVGLGQFSHIIAGSVDTFYMAVTAQANWVSVLSGYTLPTLVGNIIGGLALVTALNHAQVTAGRE